MSDTKNHSSISKNGFTPFTALAAPGYMAAHFIWKELVFGEYSFVALRLFYITFFVLLFCLEKRYQSISSMLVGKSLSRKDVISFSWFAVGCLVFRLINRAVLPGEAAFFSVKMFVDNCVIAPLNEEIVFRGIILAGLLATFPERKIESIVLSTVIFAVSHQDALSFPFFSSLLLGGLLYGVCYVRYRNVVSCLILHSAWNAMGFFHILGFFELPRVIPRITFTFS